MQISYWRRENNHVSETKYLKYPPLSKDSSFTVLEYENAKILSSLRSLPGGGGGGGVLAV